MPELPEVETVRCIMERVLVGRRIAEAEVVEDDIVLKKVPAEVVRQAIEGREVHSIGRKGKYWWIQAGETYLYGHLGMAGWIRELGAHTIRIREHGNAPLDDENGRPRFLKLLLTTEEGGKIAFTDGRRLGRLWLGEEPSVDAKLAEIGRDMWLDPWPPKELHAILSRRAAPIKALLLDQKLFCGVGNWIADEVLYQAHIRPDRLAKTLTKPQVGRLVDALHLVLEKAIEVAADKDQLPADWLFHRRWGDSKFDHTLDGLPIQRIEVGGRTTAFVPKIQK
ncbi:MAG: hypothetical protein JNJ45_06095 [Chthonomonas sp.]|nr:hypothetical protein [Chthonomonas sp.]